MVIDEYNKAVSVSGGVQEPAIHPQGVLARQPWGQQRGAPPRHPRLLRPHIEGGAAKKKLRRHRGRPLEVTRSRPNRQVPSSPCTLPSGRPRPHTPKLPCRRTGHALVVEEHPPASTQLSAVGFLVEAWHPRTVRSLVTHDFGCKIRGGMFDVVWVDLPFGGGSLSPDNGNPLCASWPPGTATPPTWAHRLSWWGCGPDAAAPRSPTTFNMSDRIGTTIRRVSHRDQVRPGDDSLVYEGS